MKTLTQTDRITRPSPLSQYEREIFAIAANCADDVCINADDIWTIRIDAETNTFWIHLRDHKQLPFSRDQFARACDKAKKEFAQRRNNKIKVTRDLVAGDKVMHDGKQWEVVSSDRINESLGHGGNFHLIRFTVILQSGGYTKTLTPYSEAEFAIATGSEPIQTAPIQEWRAWHYDDEVEEEKTDTQPELPTLLAATTQLLEKVSTHPSFSNLVEQDEWDDPAIILDDALNAVADISKRLQEPVMR